MTENLNNTTTIETPVEPDVQGLTTREILEQNWDRFVTSDEDAPLKEKETTPATPSPEEESNQEPLFDSNQLIDKAYASLKESLLKKGVSSKEEWIKSLIHMDELYHQNPQKLIKMLSAIEAKDNLNSMGYDVDRLKDNLLYAFVSQMLGKGVAPKMGPVPPQFSPTPVDASYFTQPTLKNWLDTFKSPVSPDMKHYLKEMMQQEFASLMQKNQEASQKAKDASFSLKATKITPSTSTTHTPSGRLKTTREILEEGCQLLGIV